MRSVPRPVPAAPCPAPLRSLLAVVLAGSLLVAWAPVGTVLAEERPAAGSVPDVAGRTSALARATGEAQQLSVALARAAARDGGLRRSLAELEQQHDRAQERLDLRVREVFLARRPDPLAGLARELAAPGLRRIADAGAAAAVRVDRELVDAVTSQSARVRQLRAREAAFRAGLRTRATAALAAQERARQLLAQAEAALAARRAAVLQAATAASQQAQTAARQAELTAEQERLTAGQERLTAEHQRLTATRAALDDTSARVTAAMTAPVTRRGARAAARFAPLLALAEAAGAGYPQGYVPTGQVLSGLASWYGPGFVGSPTASGVPYDPERLTCAHKTLPLGTLLRVSRSGRAVSCLVDDRGPYVGARLLDLSRAGARALGYDGVAQVVVEVLGPQLATR